MAPTAESWPAAALGVPNAPLAFEPVRIGPSFKVEDFESIALGSLAVTSGVLDGTGSTGTGTWNVATGGLISGAQHSQINATASSAFTRALAHDSTNYAVYYAAFSLSRTPTGTTPIMSAQQGSVAVAQLTVTAAGVFQQRDGTTANGTTAPFQPGRIYQVVWVVNHSASTQTANLFDEFGNPLASITGAVTATKRGITRLVFGMTAAPGAACVMRWDRVGVFVGSPAPVAVTGPLLSVDPGSPAWQLVPPGMDAPNSVPVRDPSQWWTYSSGTAPTSTPATATGSLTLGGSAGTSGAATVAGSLTLGGSGTNSGTSIATGSLTLGGSASAAASAPSATGSLSLNGTGTAAGGGQATGTGSLTLSGTASTTAPTTVAGSLAISGVGNNGAALTTTGALTITGAASAAGPAAVSGSLTLTGTSSTAGTASASGSLALSGSGTGRAPGAASGTITLVGTGLAQAQLIGLGQISLSGSGASVGRSAATGIITLAGLGLATVPSLGPDIHVRLDTPRSPYATRTPRSRYLVETPHGSLAIRTPRSRYRLDTPPPNPETRAPL